MPEYFDQLRPRIVEKLKSIGFDLADYHLSGFVNIGLYPSTERSNHPPKYIPAVMLADKQNGMIFTLALKVLLPDLDV